MTPFADKLLAYDEWGNRETIRSVQRLPAVPDRLLKLVGHLIGTEWTWLARLTGTVSARAIWPETDPADWDTELDALHVAWTAYLGEHGGDRLSESVTYTNSKGDTFSNTPADILTHVVIHSAYHRGQIATRVREVGGEPAVTDYIAFARSGR